jgi:hypothetical protein
MYIDLAFCRTRGRGWLAVILIALAAIVPFRGADTFAWQYSTPEEQDVDSESIARMLMQVQRDGIQVHSFILVRHDRIVTEVYVCPYTATTRHSWSSFRRAPTRRT